MQTAEPKRSKPLPSKGVTIPSKPLPSKGLTGVPPPPPPAPAPVEDRDAGRTDDDYYHYYLSSQKRVSKWINQTKQEMQLDNASEVSGVNDEYPASNLNFGTEISPSEVFAGGGRDAETSSSITRTTVPISGGRGEGGSRSKEASPTKLRPKESRRKIKEKLHLNGTTDEEAYETATADAKSRASEAESNHTFLPSKELRSRKSTKTPFRLDLDGDGSTVHYPDMRPRTVASGHEPTFTEVMHRLGTKNAAFGSEATALTSAHTTRSGRERDRLTKSKSRRSSSEEAPEFELSWPLVQPVLLILSSATLVVVMIPAAAAPAALVALLAIAYVMDLLPEMSPGSSRRKSSRSSSSDRHRSSRSSRRTSTR